MTAQTSADTVGGRGEVDCWCCDHSYPESGVVRLGGHPEVAVCLRCAHFLHNQARGKEDAQRPSPAARARDVLRTGRRFVMSHGWHQKPVIGSVLRWLGSRLP